MNERQKLLYETILSETEIYQDFLSKEFLCEILANYYPRHEENSSEHNSCAYGLLRKDIREINRSDEAEVIIISNYKGYKAATKEEANAYIENRFKRDLKSLKLDWQLVHKYKLNGQINIDMKEVKSFIDESL